MPTAPGSLHGIHLDLKYLMPNKRFLHDWLRRLPGYGINAVLIEYEDKFPYAKYPFLRDPDAFTPEELRDFLGLARGLGLTVIPLMQSLSHLEFALDHPQLAHLREPRSKADGGLLQGEREDIPTQICPSNPAAVEFVKDLLREVLRYHGPDPFFHLGGDEAWFLGSCEKCAAWKERAGKMGVWAEHEKKLMRFMIEAGKRPIVWNDIFWSDAHACTQYDLPKEVVFHAWNYNITSLSSASDSADEELGGAGGVLKEIEVYNAAGFGSVAGPCCNAGVLVSPQTHSIRNAAVWAKKMRASGMLGMLNTSWACFHIPLQAQHLVVAATGELCKNPDADLGMAWRRNWLEREFGGPAEGAAEALDALSAHVSIPTSELYGRNFDPIVYNYMNMALYYPGRQDERRRRGAYPLDWNEVDFRALYRKGVEFAKTCDLAPILKQLDEALAKLRPAREPLRRLADRATTHRDEAEMLALFAEMKLLSARILSHLLRNDGGAAALRAELLAQKAPLQRILAQAWEPVGQARMLRAWWEPACAALGG